MNITSWLASPEDFSFRVQAVSVRVHSNRGQGEGRGRGDWIVTQMCKTGGGDSGYLANKSRKKGRRRRRRRRRRGGTLDDIDGERQK